MRDGSCAPTCLVRSWSYAKKKLFDANRSFVYRRSFGSNPTVGSADVCSEVGAWGTSASMISVSRVVLSWLPDEASEEPGFESIFISPSRTSDVSWPTVPKPGNPKVFLDNQLAAKRPNRTFLPITSSAILPTLWPLEWNDSRIGEAGTLLISVAPPSVSVSEMLSSEATSSWPVSSFRCSLACAIALRASDCDDVGMTATSVMAYIGFPCIWATCWRCVMEMRNEWEATDRSPAIKRDLISTD